MKAASGPEQTGWTHYNESPKQRWIVYLIFAIPIVLILIAIVLGYLR
jgi:hypothetical protein